MSERRPDSSSWIKAALVVGAVSAVAGVAGYLRRRATGREPSTAPGLVPLTYTPSVNAPGQEPVVPRDARLVPARVLAGWSVFARCQDLAPDEFVPAGRAADRPVVCVSHRWITPAHPDPDGRQLRELRGRLRELREIDPRYDDCLVFYDYSAVPQSPGTPEERSILQEEIAGLGTLFGTAEKAIILSEGYRDYVQRAWCFFEAFASTRNLDYKGREAGDSTANLHLFPDQESIRSDLAFLFTIMFQKMFGRTVTFNTSFDHKYRPEYREVQNIAAVFQHFGRCGTSDPDDKRMLREMLVTEYLTRYNMTPYSRLLIGVNRYFDTTLCLITPELSICPTVAHIGQSGVRRLETLAAIDRPATGDGRVFLSPLAMTPSDSDTYQRETIAGYVLRLVSPDGEDVGRLFAEAREVRDWGEFFVPAYNPRAEDYAGRALDLFPTRDHVLHTILALNIPLIRHPGDGQVYLPIVQPDDPEVVTGFTATTYTPDGESTQSVTFYERRSGPS